MERQIGKKPLKRGVAKVPVVMQMEAAECGAACLCMVARNDGNSELFILLRDPSENTGIADEHLMTDVTIFDTDEPEPVIVGMKETEIEVVDGYAYITVVREGAINKMVGVKLSSWDGSAESGTDYGGVGVDLWFPMGITERTVKLTAAQSAERKDFYVTSIRSLRLPARS